MNAPLKAVASSRDVEIKLEAAVRGLGREARKAARTLALAPALQKNRALAAMAKAIRGARAAILNANAKDQAEAKSGGATAAFLDRLALDAERVEAMAAGLDVIRKLKIRSAASWRHGAAPTACVSSASEFRSASSA